MISVIRPFRSKSPSGRVECNGDFAPTMSDLGDCVWFPYHSFDMESTAASEIERGNNTQRRIPLAKILSSVLGIAILFSGVFTAAVSLWLHWATRSEALPGTYHAKGVWGCSTLTLRANHTFTQDVQFMEYDEPSVPPYRQHPTKHEFVEGRWEERGRDPKFLFDRRLLIKPLILLGPWKQGKVVDSFEGAYGPVMLSGLGIELDMGADIVYRK